MSSFFSSDGSFPLQFALIFAVIFVILASVAFLFRRLSGKGMALSGKSAPRGRQPRLGIVDIYELDRQRQLILLRRDNVEHLLLVGGPNDVVVERNILRGIGARLPTEDAAFDEAPEPPLDPVPEPAAPAPPPASLAPAYPPAPAYREPSVEMPVAVPAPVPGFEGSPGVVRTLDLPPGPIPEEVSPVPDPAPRPRDSQLARVVRRTPPSLTNLVPAERIGAPEAQAEPSRDGTRPGDAPATRAMDAAILSDMARELEAALRRPASAVRPAVPAQPAAVEDPVASSETPDAPAQEPPAVPSTGDPAPVIDPIAAAMAATATAPADGPAPRRSVPKVPAPEAAPPHAGATEGATPATPGRPEPIGEAPRPDESVAPNDDLFAEEVEARPTGPSPDPVPFEAAVPPVAVEAPRPADPEARAPEPSISEPSVSEKRVSEPKLPEAIMPPVKPVPPAPAPDRGAPKPPAAPNPFSVEEIEAEFARLLGRPLDRKP